MTDAALADGRPSTGETLKAGMATAAERRGRSKDLKPLAHLWPLMLAHRGDMIWALVFLLSSTCATLGLSVAARLLVDDGFSAGSATAINEHFLLLGGVALAFAAATAFRFYFVNKLGERVVADLRKLLYRHILSLDQAFFLQTRTGEVLSRLTTDIQIVEGLVGATASFALRNVLTLVGALILLLFVSPRLTGLVLLIVPVVLLPLFLYGRRVRVISVEAQDRFADAVAYAGESLDALDTVQAFGRERTTAARFDGSVEHAFASSNRRIKARATMTGLVISLVFAGIAGVLWLGAQAVVAGTMSGGTLVQFVFLSILAAGSVGAVSETWGEVQKAAGAMERISELLAARPAIASPASPQTLLCPPRGEVAFDNVTFAYPGRPDLPALRDFSLTVAPGETVALVGPSGAGKSTVFRLLLRFYDPNQGSIRLDGVDLRGADPEAVRERLALVAQDSALFSGSALDNIRFGRETATVADVRAAARSAEAEAFILALPGGFETPLGERAKTLSGGQRQRLSIARALVREAPILLLDEATSALDAENERLVQQALDAAMTGRTTLVIAHRLATVLRADRIVVMDEGRVVDEGTHAELVRRGGLYARLASLQFGQAA
jgi:ATP-binding cassette subfamily B protein